MNKPELVRCKNEICAHTFCFLREFEKLKKNLKSVILAQFDVGGYYDRVKMTDSNFKMLLTNKMYAQIVKKNHIKISKFPHF